MLCLVAMRLQHSFQHVLPSSAVCVHALGERRVQMQSHVSEDAALLCTTGCNNDSRLRLSTPWAWIHAETSMVQVALARRLGAVAKMAQWGEEKQGASKQLAARLGDENHYMCISYYVYVVQPARFRPRAGDAPPRAPRPQITRDCLEYALPRP